MNNRIKTLKNKRYLQSQDELGRGAFAIVYPGKDTQRNKLVAIKKIDAIKHREYIERIDQECQLHQSLQQNCHVLEFIENFNENNQIYIITELCEFGDLDNFIQRFPNKILPEDVARLFANQILFGFLSLYELEIIHRDMKLQNILVNKNFECKIADFGLAKSSHDLGQTQAGTPLTMAPEVLFGENYDGQCDVWSFGCIIYAMTHGKYPFLPMGINKRKELEDMVRNRRLVFDNPNISNECKQFIDKTLQVDPKKRITFQDMFQEPWLLQCTREDYTDQVIKTHLKHLVYREVHIDSEFALQFGISLLHYVNITIKRHCQMLEGVYLQFINKQNQSSQEKKILYLLNLLITKICEMTIEFIYKDQNIKLPLTQDQIQMFQNIITEENFKQSKAICEKSQLDLTPLLQTLNTTLLQIASNELEQCSNLNQYQNDFGQVISLIDLLTDSNFGLPFEIHIDAQQSNTQKLQQIENISIREAYTNIDESVDKEFIDLILQSNQIKFACKTKNFYQLQSEKDSLQNIKQILNMISEQ